MQHALFRSTQHLAPALLLGAALSGAASAADYAIDPTHSFVEFRVQHLGYSWLYGRFNGIEGGFSYDAAKPEQSVINITIDTGSIDSNHAERDKHLRSAEFLDTSKFPRATFKSTGYKGDASGGVLTGELSFHGVTKTIAFPVKKVGEGDDPWGGYRAGFHGSYTMTRADFGIDYNLGPAATTVELELGVEGIRK